MSYWPPELVTGKATTATHLIDTFSAGKLLVLMLNILWPRVHEIPGELTVVAISMIDTEPSKRMQIPDAIRNVTLSSPSPSRVVSCGSYRHFCITIQRFNTTRDVMIFRPYVAGRSGRRFCLGTGRLFAKDGA